MYGNFFGALDESDDTTKKHKKSHRKKRAKKKTRDAEAHHDVLPGDALSDDEIPVWAAPNECGRVYDEMEALLNTLRESQAAQADALKKVQALRAELACANATMLRLEVMQKHALTREDYEEQYEKISGGCCLS